MRTKVLIPSLVVLMAGLAACGGTSTSSSTSSSSPPTAKKSGKPRIYRIALTGTAETPAGAPAGKGAAVIAFHGSTVVCWRFAHLHGFANATLAHIHAGAEGKSGKVVVPLSTASKLHHQGCVHVSSTLTRAIEHNPRKYYVNIHSAQYPGGAVRGQL